MIKESIQCASGSGSAFVNNMQRLLTSLDAMDVERDNHDESALWGAPTTDYDPNAIVSEMPTWEAEGRHPLYPFKKARKLFYCREVLPALWRIGLRYEERADVLGPSLIDNALILSVHFIGQSLLYSVLAFSKDPSTYDASRVAITLMSRRENGAHVEKSVELPLEAMCMDDLLVTQDNLETTFDDFYNGI